jgi:hypothetical protein
MLVRRSCGAVAALALAAGLLGAVAPGGDATASSGSWQIAAQFSSASGDVAFSGISCTTAADCYAVANGPATNAWNEVHVTVTAGTVDVTAFDEGASLWSVTCLQDGPCAAGGTDAAYHGVLYALPEGRSGVSRVVDTDAAVSAVSCGSSSHCVAIDRQWCDFCQGSPSAILTSSSIDGRWHVSSPPKDTQMLTTVSCATSRLCVAGGVHTTSHGPLLLRSTDGGRSWQTVASPKGTTEVDLVSCPTATRCYAMVDVGTRVLVSTDGGRHWSFGSRLRLGKRHLEATGLSCTSAEDCTAVAGYNPAAVVQTTTGWRTWTVTTVPSLAKLYGVDCIGSDCWIDGLSGDGHGVILRNF